MNILIEHLRGVGKHPICSGYRSRAPVIFGWCFPLCYRCTAFIISLIFSELIGVELTVIWTCILLFPMVVDGVFQYFLHRESTTIRRILTGTLAGVGIAPL